MFRLHQITAAGAVESRDCLMNSKSVGTSAADERSRVMMMMISCHLTSYNVKISNFNNDPTTRLL